MSRVRITVRGGRSGPIAAKGQDIGVYAEIDGKRAILPVTSLVLTVTDRKTVARCELMVDEVDVVGVEADIPDGVVPRFVDKERKEQDDDA